MAEVKNRTVYVQPTTGGIIEVSLPPESSVSILRFLVAKRLKVPKDKIVLLHKNKQLIEGSLEENNILDGSKLTLLPNVETGIMTQNPEQCVMQALETLNESQVDNFLAGRSPLNLTMRLGDHMMFIQLQLSTVLPSSGNNSPSTSSPSSSLSTPPTTPTSPTLPSSTLPFPPPLLSAVPTLVPNSIPTPPPSPKSTTAPSIPKIPLESSRNSSLNNKVFTEASRSLTQTLRQLSSSALTKKMNESCDGRCCIARRQGGAVIESMYHHGRGVFSGTFSGTLSPVLQDKDGRPRRNICTIIHILNDLLGASSHCNPSSQCLCSNATATQSKPQKTSVPQKIKVNEELKQDENKILREKVEHIQTMLRERRQNRTTRRDVRAAPYSTGNRSSGKNSSNFDSNGVFLLQNPDCSEPKLMDYSSETAVA